MQHALGNPEHNPQCIFCERPKYVNRTLEKLVKATQLRVDQTLRQIATARCDQRILAITSRDIVAAEAHYHRSCYRDYTRPAQQQQPEKNEPEDAAEYDAFLDLFRFIRTDVLDLQVVITMIELTKTLESFLQTRGVEKLGESTKKHIRRKLESEFGSTLEIFPDEKGKLLVMPANLNAKETVKKLINVEKELKSVKSKSTELQSIVDQSAQHLRNVILDIKWTFPWPILPSDLSVDQFPVPGCLHRFLMGLLTSNSDMTNPSPRVKMLIESFSQDLIYAVTCGKTKPPKHILLSYGVKTLTGNVEVIRMLNRFGHGVSYSQLEENDTALCFQKLAANLNQTTILPGTIQPNVFTNLAWDNIDRLEETLTGKGTTHRVNGIAVQPRVFGPHPPPAELPPILKRKQRSISHTKSSLCPCTSPTSRALIGCKLDRIAFSPSVVLARRVVPSLDTSRALIGCKLDRIAFSPSVVLARERFPIFWKRVIKWVLVLKTLSVLTCLMSTDGHVVRRYCVVLGTSRALIGCKLDRIAFSPSVVLARRVVPSLDTSRALIGCKLDRIAFSPSVVLARRVVPSLDTSRALIGCKLDRIAFSPSVVLARERFPIFWKRVIKWVLVLKTLSVLTCLMSTDGHVVRRYCVVLGTSRALIGCKLDRIAFSPSVVLARERFPIFWKRVIKWVLVLKTLSVLTCLMSTDGHVVRRYCVVLGTSRALIGCKLDRIAFSPSVVLARRVVPSLDTSRALIGCKLDRIAFSPSVVLARACKQKPVIL
ncbi:hypothetical protein QZH41_001183 [Actinostola sp. cb2023]|nr:hypothetical protein QZH41_001183 [Actinostola sp. cb2023]